MYSYRYVAGSSGLPAGPVSPLRIASTVRLCDTSDNASKLSQDLRSGFVMPDAQVYAMLSDTGANCNKTGAPAIFTIVPDKQADPTGQTTQSCTAYRVGLTSPQAENNMVSTATLRDCTTPQGQSATGLPQGGFVIDGAPIGMKGDMYCALQHLVDASGKPISSIVACRHIDLQQPLYVSTAADLCVGNCADFSRPQSPLSFTPECVACLASTGNISVCYASKGCPGNNAKPAGMSATIDDDIPYDDDCPHQNKIFCQIRDIYRGDSDLYR